MKFPDFHNGRTPIPFTRKEYESWGKERESGRSKIVRQSVLWAGGTFGLIGVISICVLFFFSNREIPDGWPLLISVPVFGLTAFGMGFGWLVSNMTWSLFEARYAATNPSDLDNENLEAGRIEQNRVAISGIPFLIGVVAFLLIPEKYASISLVGVGVSMSWFGYIMLSSTVEPTNDSDSISRPKIWFVFLVGIGTLVAAIYFTIMAAIDRGNAG